MNVDRCRFNHPCIWGIYLLSEYVEKYRHLSEHVGICRNISRVVDVDLTIHVFGGFLICRHMWKHVGTCRNMSTLTETCRVIDLSAIETLFDQELGPKVCTLPTTADHYRYMSTNVNYYGPLYLYI